MTVETRTVSSPKGEITIYKLTNVIGASVEISTLGAGIVSVVVPNSKGELADVLLGYANPADYLYDGPCAGKVPGRYANRIAKGKLTVAGKTYQLAINNGPNALHGGPEGYQNQIWKGEVVEGAVELTIFSPDGDENYPGNLTAKAIYSWSDNCELTLVLKAKTDAETVINLTNHAYFNLDGESAGNIFDHELWLACSNYTPTDETLIPTGEIAPVAGTPMDFTRAKALGKDIKKDFPALNYGKGYDNCWLVDNWDGTLKKVALLTSKAAGRAMEVYTDQPAAQVYTGNWLAGSPINKSGRSMDDYDGVAIECQGVPDAPNQPQFPPQVLRPGEEYKRTIIFSFKAL